MKCIRLRTNYRHEIKIGLHKCQKNKDHKKIIQCSIYQEYFKKYALHRKYQLILLKTRPNLFKI
jgi:hypothetical protein